MIRSLWRLRLVWLRWIPHTPVKRWTYGAVTVAVVILAATGRWPAAVAGFALAIGARFLDLRRSSRRRPKFATRHAYFFEGSDVDGGR